MGRMLRGPLAILLALLCCVAAADDAAARRPRGASKEYREALVAIDALLRAKPPSRSTGTYTKGGLENGAELPAKGFGYRLADAKRGTHTGSDAMVAGIMELAALLQERHPGSPWLSIGDISKPGGGKLDPHINHQDGCDCDLAFLYCTAEGAPCDKGWLKCDAEGKTKLAAASFDVARNFEMLTLVLESPWFGTLDWIFVHEPLKKLLVAHGRELAKKTPKAAERIDAITAQLEKLLREPESNPHDDHFHIRVKKPMH
jgi:penicillin-insensitive murein endopeptidase